MLGVKDKGILLQIIKRCNRVIEKVSNVNIIEFAKEYNKIPLKQIIGMRNRIVHGYDTINLEIVWNTANESIPELKSYCKEILG